MSDAVALSVAIRSGSATDVGLRRKVNEDSLLVGHPVYVVADGMGGHEAGDRASQAVVAELLSLVGRDDLVPDDLSRSIDAAHATVRALADSTSRGAGTTVTGAVVIDHGGRPHWLVFNIGDSRVYRERDGELAQLTVDHSIAQEMIESGELDRAAVGDYKGRNVITKAVGAVDSEADFWLYPIVAHERLVICSDGLTGEVTDAAIAEIVVGSPDPQSAADLLVRAALAGGGRDNVTVVVVEVTAGGIAPALDEATSVIPPAATVEDDDGTTVEMPRKKGATRAR